jgi:signal peptidase
VILGALALNLGMAMLPFLGYQPTAITGGSMAPAIGTGALIVTRAVPADSLQAGDIITYRRDGAQATVTHRIVAEHVVNGQRAFTTKGDANDDPDPIDISFSSDVQKVVYTAPYAGYMYTTLRNPRMMLLLTALPAIGLAALFVLGMGKPRRHTDAAGA